VPPTSLRLLRLTELLCHHGVGLLGGNNGGSRELRVSSGKVRSLGKDSPQSSRRSCAEDHATILVVEDEVLVRIMVAEELRAQGDTVIEATSASEAISVLQSSGMRIDLVLTDIRMPGDLDGLGLARMMRSEHPLVKVVMASGRKPDTEENDIVDGFFFKPYDLPKLVSHIKSLLI
jgi:CheY-like chemotaxis protein